MSCHSTPANIAVLGYASGAYGLDAQTVESEFHWLKRVGRDRQTPPPTEEQWQEFCDQQGQWIAHDNSLSDMRRTRLSERIAAARGDIPDGPTFYALENIPARLAYVTDPATVRTTLKKVQSVTDRAAKESQADVETLREAALGLRRAEALLANQPAPDASDLASDPYGLVDEAAESTEMIDIYLTTPRPNGDNHSDRERLYQAHRWIASSLRMLKRQPTV